MAEIHQQNPDGSWSPAEPMGWQPVPGGDWEVGQNGRGLYRATLYDKHELLTTVESRWRLVLAVKMRWAVRRFRRG